MKLIGLLLACSIVVVIVLWSNPAFQPYQEEIRRILPQDIPSLKSDSGQTSDASTQTKVYKIRNQDGSWTYTNQVDNDTEATETLTYRSDTNVTPVVDMPPPSTPQTADTPSSASTEDTITPLTPYTNPGRVMQLIEDAKNLQKTMDDRTRQIDEQVNQQFQAKPDKP